MCLVKWFLIQIYRGQKSSNIWLNEYPCKCFFTFPSPKSKQGYYFNNPYKNYVSRSVTLNTYRKKKVLNGKLNFKPRLGCFQTSVIKRFKSSGRITNITCANITHTCIQCHLNAGTEDQVGFLQHKTCKHNVRHSVWPCRIKPVNTMFVIQFDLVA